MKWGATLQGGQRQKNIYFNVAKCKFIKQGPKVKNSIPERYISKKAIDNGHTTLLSIYHSQKKAQDKQGLYRQEIIRYGWSNLTFIFGKV